MVESLDVVRHLVQLVALDVVAEKGAVNIHGRRSVELRRCD